MLVVSAISGNFFFSWPENLLRLLMRWRWVCILVLITYLIHHFLHRNFSAVLSDVTRTIPSWLVSLGLLATTDHSEGSGWRGDAILFFQPVSTTPSQWKILKVPSFPSVHIIYLIYAFSSRIPICLILPRSIRQWYSHPPLRAGWSRSWLLFPDLKGNVKIYDRDLPGPRSISFAGLRCRVDCEEQYISWMGWRLYLGFNRDIGIEFIGPWWSSYLWGGHVVHFSITVWLNNCLDWLSLQETILILFLLSSFCYKMQLVMIVQLPAWIVFFFFPEWVNSSVVASE